MSKDYIKELCKIKEYKKVYWDRYVLGFPMKDLVECARSIKETKGNTDDLEIQLFLAKAGEEIWWMDPVDVLVAVIKTSNKWSTDIEKNNDQWLEEACKRLGGGE